MAEPVISEKLVPIDWVVPDDIVTRYATNIVVQRSEHEFIISFFEAEPPIIVGPDDRKEKALASIQSVQARCVARIVVAPKRVDDFVRVLTEQIEAAKTRQKEVKED
jgi:hypothetical protein